MNKIYTGVGSREAPEEVLKEFTRIAKVLDNLGYTLRSGAAEGCDSAFEEGSTRKEIFLPWKNFNKSTSKLYLTEKNNSIVYPIAAKLYPGWIGCKPGVKMLHARNVQQVLGETPGTSIQSDFLICWSNRPVDQWRGTMFAVNLAKSYNIQTYNFFFEEEKIEFYKEYMVEK